MFSVVHNVRAKEPQRIWIHKGNSGIVLYLNTHIHSTAKSAQVIVNVIDEYIFEGANQRLPPTWSIIIIQLYGPNKKKKANLTFHGS